MHLKFYREIGTGMTVAQGKDPSSSQSKNHFLYIGYENFWPLILFSTVPPLALAMGWIRLVVFCSYR